MSSQLNIVEIKAYDCRRECGRIFLDLSEHLIFHCTICLVNFCSFVKYRDHIKILHCRNLGNQSSDDERFDAGNSISKDLMHENDKTSESAYSETLMEPEIENLQVLEKDEVDMGMLEKLESKDQTAFAKKRKIAAGRQSSVCPVCNETLSKNTHLKTHMKRHTSEKNYKCSSCTKAFFTRCELDTHIRTHSGERPYLCTACGEAFTTASKLKAHINYKHIRKRDKQCPICNMSFYSTVLLKGHMITHDDSRPFECEKCDSKFKQRKGLRSHMKMHENKKEHACDLCPARFNQKCNLNSHRKYKHGIIAANEDVSCNSEGTYVKAGNLF